MTLIIPELSGHFRSVIGERSQNLAKLTNVGMVGASVDSWLPRGERTPTDYILEPFEESFLIAGNRLLQPHGYELGADAAVNVSELKSQSDFLKDAFNAIHVQMLVLSSLYYNPDRDPDLGENTMQSPLAHDPENWVKTIERMAPTAILNIWKADDQDSGKAISEIIDRVGTYQSVYDCDSELVGWDDTYDGFPVNNGGDLFLRKLACG